MSVVWVQSVLGGSDDWAPLRALVCQWPYRWPAGTVLDLLNQTR
jgi:hypothetical protein